MKTMIKNQTGDTIVEVLIAIAIVGFTMVGAYSLATRSLKGARIAQERTEALKIAESQLERLKYFARSYGEGFVTEFRVDNFCLNSTPAKVANPPTPPFTGCAQGLYETNITYLNHPDFTDPTNPFGIYTIRVEWDSLSSQGRENVTIKYQL